MVLLLYGYLVKCNLAPDRRPSSLKAIQQIFESLPEDNFQKLYIQLNDVEYTEAVVDAKLSGYTIDITKGYFDCACASFLNAPQELNGNYYLFLHAFPTPFSSYNDIPSKPTVSSYPEYVLFSDYFAFVSRVERNSLYAPNILSGDTDMYRVYFNVDWWTTAFMYNTDVDVYGEVLRAHVNDISSAQKCTFDSFTDEAEISLPENAFAIDTVKLGPDFVFTVDEQATNKYKNKITKDDIMFMYVILKNTSIISEQSGVAEKILDKSTVTNLGTGASLFSNTIGNVYWFPIAMNFEDSPVATDEAKGFDAKMSKIDYMNDDRILAMYISQVPPQRVEIFITDSSLAYTDFPIIRVRDVNTHEILPYKLMSYWTSEETGYKFIVYPYTRPESFGLSSIALDNDKRVYDIDSTLIDGYITQVKHKEDSDAKSAYDLYLQNLVIKSHCYPYSYYSLYSNGREVAINQTIRPSLQYRIFRDPITGSWFCVSLNNPKGSSYVTPQFTYVFHNTGLSAPFFSESWLQRENALDEAAHSKAMAIARAFTTPFTDVANTAGAVVSGNIGKALSTAMNANVNSFYATEQAFHTSKIANREIAYIRDGGMQGASIPTQFIAGLTADDCIYQSMTYLRDDILDTVNLNLHLYGYSTKLDVYNIRKNHKRRHFNFIQTLNASVLPLGNNVYYTPQAIADIVGMFNNGVWLIHDDKAERTLLIANLPENVY